MIHSARVLVLVALAALTLHAQPLDRPLKPFLHLLKPAGPPPQRVDCFIPVGTSDSLDCTYYIPASQPPEASGYPAMVFVHGFGLNKTWDTASAAYWGSQGYLSLCYSVRAHGSSSGTSSIMGPRERSDLADVIAFIASLPEVNPAEIGIQGGSQGGLHALWAAADRVPVQSASADVITPHWASDMFMNGCYRQTLSFLLTTSTVRYDQQRDTLWELLQSDAYEELRRRFAQGRDVDTALLYASEIPLASFVKWQDHYFSAADGIESFGHHRGPGKLYAGTGGHYSDDDPGQWSTQWSLIWQWHDRFVRGMSNGIELPPDLIYATSSLPKRPDGSYSWSQTETTSWPPPGLDSARFYLHGGGMLGLDRPAPGVDSVLVENLWDGFYSFQTGFIEGFEGVSFESALPTSVASFESAALPQEMLWVGSPVLRLFLRSDEDRFPLHARIFEVASDGQAHLVNRVNFTARNWTPGMAQWVEVTGIAHAHRFSAGSKIRVELTNIDHQSGPEWGNTPFVLPLFTRTQVAVSLDSAHSASIVFPIVGTAPLPIVLAEFSAVPDPDGETVLLHWSTLSESNNYGFFLERGVDVGGEFQLVAFVPAQTGPNSVRPLQYVYRDTPPASPALWYRLRQVDLDGATFTSEAVRLEPIHPRETPALTFRLEQNYPNPFNPVTTIRYSLPLPARARIDVLDLTGRTVATLLDEELSAGEHLCRWEASGQAAGVYFVRLRAAGAAIIRRMILLR